MSPQNADQPVFVPPGGGDTVHLVGDTYTMLLTAAQTGGGFSLSEALVPVAGGPPPHRHLDESETFVLVAGQLAVNVGEEQYEAAAGSVVHIPKGTRHSFRNLDPEAPARMLVVFAPGGMEAMFGEIGRPGTRGVLAPAGPEDVERMVAMGQKYRYTFD